MFIPLQSRIVSTDAGWLRGKLKYFHFGPTKTNAHKCVLCILQIRVITAYRPDSSRWHSSNHQQDYHPVFDHRSSYHLILASDPNRLMQPVAASSMGITAVRFLGFHTAVIEIRKGIPNNSLCIESLRFSRTRIYWSRIPWFCLSDRLLPPRKTDGRFEQKSSPSNSQQVFSFQQRTNVNQPTKRCFPLVSFFFEGTRP